jgi:hypothetical protein
MKNWNVRKVVVAREDMPESIASPSRCLGRTLSRSASARSSAPAF